MSANPQVNIVTLHEKIKEALAAQFPDCTVDYYPRPGDKITTPAIFIELDEVPCEDPPDIGTDQTPVNLMFNAYCVEDYKAGKKLVVRTLAIAVLAFVNSNKWTCPVKGGKAIGAFPDNFHGKKHAAGDTEEYECMRVEWQHEALLGTDAWEFSGEFPTLVKSIANEDAEEVVFPQT
jgi:hypothetical protein